MDTTTIKPLEWGSWEYDHIYTHLEQVLEQSYGIAAGNHAALIIALKDIGIHTSNKIEAINVAKRLVGFPEGEQDWS